MAALPLKTWTREEYRRLAEAGIIASEERLELLDGQIVHKMTQNPPHVLVLGLLEDWLRAVIGSDYHVRSQSPIALSDTSEPEPDLAVVAGGRRSYDKRHPAPSEIELLVEVSHAGIDGDRRVKAPLYAAAGIKELWIVDAMSRKLEIHREPLTAGYRVVSVMGESEPVGPLFSPQSLVVVSDLLPAVL